MSYLRLNICRKCSAVLIFLLFFQVAYNQFSYSELNSFLDANQKMLGQNAVAMIWKDDSLVFKKEMGDFNSRTRAPIASCSKWLTAALVMTFVDEGKLSLDDKVSSFIPEFAKYGKNYITIRHCLSHMTGIESEPIKILKLLQRRKYNSLEEEVNDFAHKNIQTNPGTEFRYSTIGLNIAGRILEIISKRRFDMLMRQRIFVPLGMRSSTFSTLDGSAINPSGGAISTAEDYMKFMVMLMQNGKYAGKQILSENAINEMKTVQTTAPLIAYAPPSAAGFNYALGAWVFQQDGKQATVLSSPGLFGTWPVIDYCRGYAYLYFVKNFLGEERADLQLQAMDLMNNHFKSSCK